MKSLVFLLTAAAALAPVDGYACRCQQRPLSDYFAAADQVVIAKLTASSEVADNRFLSFKLLAEPYKGNDALRAGDSIDVVTATSSATCGIAAEPEAVYVVFAQEHPDDDRLHVDSCSGTRVHLAPGQDEAQGFDDVPARFVAQQLNGMAGMLVLAEVAAHAPDASDQDNDSLIGLLDIAVLAHGGFVELFAQPEASQPAVLRVDSYAQLETREYAYEQPGAVVYAIRDGWYRLRQRNGSYAWLQASDAGTYFDYANLPIQRLAYLNGNWSGLVWPEPGAGLPYRHPRGRQGEHTEVAVHVLESKTIGGLPWFRVEVLNGPVCSGEEPGVAVSGWVPVYGRNGGETAWFWSRGC